MTIHTTSFRHLDIETLYDILQLRSEVFVVEQNCVYQDLDGIDKNAMHSWIVEEGKMVAYARFFMTDRARSRGKGQAAGAVCLLPDAQRHGKCRALFRCEASLS